MLPGGELGRPMLMTPGAPPERIKIFREAYAKVPGKELEELIKTVMGQPKEMVDRVKKMLGS